MIEPYTVWELTARQFRKVFDYITAADRIEIDYEMRITKDFTAENISKLVNKIDQYCKNAKNNIHTITSLVESVYKELK